MKSKEKRGRNIKVIISIIILVIVAILAYSTLTNPQYSPKVQISDISNKLFKSGAGSGKITTPAQPIGEPCPEESLLFQTSSNKLNLGETLTEVFGSQINKGDLPETLKDGTYVADDNDEFDYEQTLTLHDGLQVQHFRDADYEDEAGLTERTPTLGIRINSGQQILNYKLDFVQNARSSITENHLDDFEHSTLEMMGQKYHIYSALAEPLTLNTMIEKSPETTIQEGETITYLFCSVVYEISLEQVTLETKTATISINGEQAVILGEGEAYRLPDGNYFVLSEIYYSPSHPETNGIEFFIGQHKVEMTNNQNIKVDDENIDGLTATFDKTINGNELSLDKINLHWTADDENFIAPLVSTKMPGLETLEFTWDGFVTGGEEEFEVSNSLTAARLTGEFQNGEADILILYTNGTEIFEGIGAEPWDRLATSDTSILTFVEKDSNGDDYHAFFIASYKSPDLTYAESHALKAEISYSEFFGQRATFYELIDGGWELVCLARGVGETCQVGLVSIAITEIDYTPGGTESAEFLAGTGVNFFKLYTKDGLTAVLPVEHCSKELSYAICPGEDNTFNLWFTEEDDQNKIEQGEQFYLTLGINSFGQPEVIAVNGEGTGGPDGLQIGTTGIYESYIYSPLATKIIHYTSPSPKYADIEYHGEEAYANIFLKAYPECPCNRDPGLDRIPAPELPANESPQTPSPGFPGGLPVPKPIPPSGG